MDVILYDRRLNAINWWHHSEAPTLKELKVKGAVVAFDQSTKSSGVTVGDSEGRIHGYLRLTRSNSKEKSAQYIIDFEDWMLRFFEGSDTEMVLHEDVFSMGFYRTDQILNRLLGTFETARLRGRWSWKVSMIKQQDWKPEIIRNKSGSKSLTKENVQEAVEVLMPHLPIRDDLEDIYDSIGIYYFYTKRYMSRDLSVPYEVTTTISAKPRCNFEYYISCGEKPKMSEAGRLVETRGVRKFVFNASMSPRENVHRLASNSNDVWVGEVPETCSYIVPALWELGRLPEPGEKIWLIGFRKNKGNFDFDL